MKKFWGPNAQQSDYSQQYWAIHFKVAKRLDLNCSHHTKEIIIMRGDKGVG